MAKTEPQSQAKTPAAADDVVLAEKQPYYGGGVTIIQSKNRGKRPGDLPESERKPRKLSKEDAERKPGLPEEVLQELAKEKKWRDEAAAKALEKAATERQAARKKK